MGMLSRLRSKKGLIVVTLLMAAMFLGAWEVNQQCVYTWDVSYRINPLTSFEEIEVPKTMGATKGWSMWGKPPFCCLPEYVEEIQVDKKLEIFFFVSEEDTENLAEYYCDLCFSVHIYGPGKDGKL